MFTASDISSISDAARTRDAVMEVRNREMGMSRSFGQVSGPRYQVGGSSDKLPVVETGGKPFLEPLLSKNTQVSLPKDIQKNSILEYKDQTTGLHYYGQVTSSGEGKESIEVKNITKSEADRQVTDDSGIKVYSLNQNDLDTNQNSSAIKSLLSLLDPSESFVFKLMTTLLVGNIFKSESLTDIFMAVYIRIVGLAVAVISLIYISVVLF